MPASRERTREALAVFGLFLAVNLYSALVQRTTSAFDGRGYDGDQYFDVAEHFSRRERPEADGPYVYRIGTPVLACLLPGGPSVATFRAVNLAANALTTVLLIIWLRRFIGSWRVRVALCALFLTQWHGPVRFVYYCPVTVDPWAFTFLLAGLIGIEAARGHGTRGAVRRLDAAAFLGVIFKEILLLVPVSLLLARNPVGRGRGIWPLKAGGLPRWFFFDPLVFGILGVVVTRAIASQSNAYSYWETALHWAFAKPLPAYLLAWCTAFGPVLVLILYRWRESVGFLRERQAELVVLAGFAASAWVGGTDTERILYFAAPIVYVLLGRAMEASPWVLRSWGLVLALAVAQGLSQRLLWPIPDLGAAPFCLGLPVPRWLPLLSPLTRTVQYWDLWSTFAPRLPALIALLEYAALGAALLIWLKAAERRLGGHERSCPAPLTTGASAKGGTVSS